MDNSTIAAIATPTGLGGIGIIKISGRNALSIAAKLFKRSPFSSNTSKETSCSVSFKSHRLYHGYIVDPEKERVLDEVLLAAMISPHSYTTEDVIEIQAHSGHLVINCILELVLKNGARLAEPGEFTKRAYLNGRIDLTQAEAVIDIIKARTEKSLGIAFAQIKGEIRARVELIKNSLLNILAMTEARIDFPDDIEEDINPQAILETIEHDVAVPLKKLVRRYEDAHVLRDGLKLVVVGKPNVGKSSLMNSMIQNERAIVTSVPGTTRDIIEETLSIHGIPVIITDTAGLHDTDNPVEVIGINKTHEYIDKSDMVLFMVDACSPLTSDDHKIYETIKDRSVLLVINKTDLVDGGVNFNTPDSWGQIPRVNISALYNRGIDDLKNLIVKYLFGEHVIEAQNMIVPSLRHKLAFDRALCAAYSAIKGINSGTPFELIAIDIREGIDSLGEIIGVNTKEDVLDKIFSNFCIGK